jgi:hypothetical protein
VAGPDTGGDDTVELVDIRGAHVTVELDPGDCLALAQACRAQMRNDATPDFQLAATLAVALEGLGMAAFALEDPQDRMGRALLWSVWGPLETREASTHYHTDLDGNRAEAPAPACAEEVA